MKLRTAALLLVCLLLSPASASTPGAVVAPGPGALAADVARLAAPDMEGRGSATPGGDRAARLLAEWMAAAGLAPGGDGGTFLQSLPISSEARLRPGSALERSRPDALAFAAGRDFAPHGGSLEGDVAAPVVFAGYGVVAESAGYDDYAGVDVNGKIVLLLDGAPPHLKGPSPSRPMKLVTARQRRARAVIVVAETLPGLDATSTAVALLSATVRPAVADALLAPAGTTVTRLARTIADTRRPASLATGSEARLRVALERVEQRAANVVGILRGTDPALAGEAVVVGAHYDHLGVVNDVVHAGADDNASGTAAVVGLARAFAAAGGTPRTLVFVLFTGEELGLMGSRHHVRHPAWPLARTVAMVNLDMVGRLRNDRLSVGGVDTGTALREMVVEAARDQRLDLALNGAPFARSDHASFYGAGIPVLFFFTGVHDDYHRATDTADRINADGLARITAVTARVVERLASAATRPTYAVIARPPRPRGPSGAAFLGVSGPPRSGDGVRLSLVLPGSAAARAGLRAGDVLLHVAGVPLGSFQDLQTEIRRRRPGDGLEVVYLRDGHERAAAATLDATPDDAN